MTNQKLKSCPFCGGEVRNRQITVNIKIGCYFVECGKCFARTRLCSNDEEAIAAWNKRKGEKA